MKQTLPDYIKQNEDLRKILLAQKGGIMKYLADHLDANGTAELFASYQNKCVDEFFENNKWDLLVVRTDDETRRAALGYEHLFKELRSQRELKEAVSDMPDETVRLVHDFTELYLAWAYKQNRMRWLPNGMTPIEVYQETIGMYSSNGLAYKCMKHILKEHHANGQVEKTNSELYVEFQIRQSIDNLTIGNFLEMRKAVAEMLAGKDADQCRQMAVDTMERVRGFSQMIYTDMVVQSLKEIEHFEEADRREKDGEWLRNETHLALRETFSDNIRTHSMRFYFAVFVSLLEDLGQIWAAQLLVHEIDMKELEKEVACIMNPSNTPRYYIDRHYADDQPGLYCVSNSGMVERLLQKMGRSLSQECYLELAEESEKTDVMSKLFRAYEVLVKEEFIDSRKTKSETFFNVMINNKESKIIWINDPRRKYLKALIEVFMGQSKTYSYDAIFKVGQKGQQWTFIKQHFVDEKGNDIIIKSNTTKLGKKDKAQFERILKAIYFSVQYRQNTK